LPRTRGVGCQGRGKVGCGNVYCHSRIIACRRPPAVVQVVA
jgi:hypothetical protein